MSTALLGIGGLMCIVGWLWLIFHAFSTGKPVWGFLNVCGLLALIYGFMHFQTAKVPTLILAGGMVLNIIGGAMGGGAVVPPQ